MLFRFEITPLQSRKTKPNFAPLPLPCEN